MGGRSWLGYWISNMLKKRVSKFSVWLDPPRQSSFNSINTHKNLLTAELPVMPTMRKAKGWEWKWMLVETRVSGILCSFGEAALMFFWWERRLCRRCCAKVLFVVALMGSHREAPFFLWTQISSSRTGPFPLCCCRKRSDSKDEQEEGWSKSWRLIAALTPACRLWLPFLLSN